MSNKVTIVFDTSDKDGWITQDVEHVGEFIASQFLGGFPETARIYCGQVSCMTDVTPTNESEIARLETLTDQIFVVVYPGEPTTIIYGLIAVLAIAVVVLSKQIPNAAARNTQAQSSNNELSERVNKPRLNGRIPDIFGTVRSTPDLLSAPYTIYDNSNREVEYCYMCVGRGYYDIPASSVRDDTTAVNSIPGTSIAVYAPYTSPNSGHAPQLLIGSAINTRLKDANRSNSVNGQVLRAPNDQVVRGNSNIKFKAPNLIIADPASDINFEEKFDNAGSLTIEGAVKYDGFIAYNLTLRSELRGFSYRSTVNPPVEQIVSGMPLRPAVQFFYEPEGAEVGRFIDVGGLYEVESVEVEPNNPLDPGDSTFRITVQLVTPQLINGNWLNLPTGLTNAGNIQVPSGNVIYNLNGTYNTILIQEKQITLNSPEFVNDDWLSITETEYLSPTIFVNNVSWVGPFVLPGSNLTEIFFNFVAQNGLYKTDANGQTAIGLALAIEVTPVDADGNPSGPSQQYGVYMQGSDKNAETVGKTVSVPNLTPSRYSVRARRATEKDYDFEGQVVDEIKWRDVYGVRAIDINDFGNVTTVQTVTLATAGALAVKERKLNMLASRKIPKRISGSNFTTELFPTTNPAEIFCAISLDKYIGNRSVNELNVDSIYSAVAQAYDYFGNDKAVGFSYTLDSTNLSYEETAKLVAECAFSTAYRRGNILNLNFEKPTENSTLLFNHSNKLPASETRTTRFGNQDNYDGLSYTYVDPSDDAIVTYYIPEDRTSINPREIESVGVRSKLQARFMAYREWNRIKFGNTIVEFGATQEASMLVTHDRILVADGTRPGVIDGDIVEQFGVTVTLSRPVTLPLDPFLFVQHDDGTTESIAVAGQLDPYTLTLANAPRRPLATGADLYARCAFILVGNQNTRQNAFLVTEKNPKENMTVTVTAVNYDDRYYQNDGDFKNGIVDQNGNYI